jgi:DNA-binding response OmpR family regulator
VDGEGKLVLIVDDEPDIRSFLADLLTTHGFRCAWADSGGAALSQIGPLQPDLVLLDIMMPGMSGIEVLRHIREREDVDPAVVMLSCLSHPNTTLRALDEGADHFVVKPFRVSDLMETLDNVIAKRAATAEQVV